MKLERLNPWNWFKHEDHHVGSENQVPVARTDALGNMALQPLDSFMQIHREMDRLFDDAIRSFGLPGIGRRFQESFRPLADLREASDVFRPNTDVSGDDHKYEISLDLPGLKQEDISIELQDRMLVIKGEKESKEEDTDKKFYRVERHYGSFQRTLALPDDAAAEDITAAMKDGVLTVSVPRIAIENKEVKRISISS